MQSQKFHHYTKYPSAAEQTPADELKFQKEVGLWIDHRKAVIVTLTEEGHQTKLITSNIESDTRPSAGWPAHSGQDYRSNAEVHQERRLTGHLDKYYDEVIKAVIDAESILIFGPGEAKGELKKRLESKGLHGRTVAVESADIMTDHQIAAKVRQHFIK